MVRATGVAPTAEQNTDAVWDEPISGHLVAGTTGILVSKLDTIFNNYARRTAFTYDASLAGYPTG